MSFEFQVQRRALTDAGVTLGSLDRTRRHSGPPALTSPKIEEPKVVRGDLDNDGKVDGADLGLLLGQWGSASKSADFDNNGIVDGQDLKLFMKTWVA